MKGFRYAAALLIGVVLMSVVVVLVLQRLRAIGPMDGAAVAVAPSSPADAVPHDRTTVGPVADTGAVHVAVRDSVRRDTSARVRSTAPAHRAITASVASGVRVRPAWRPAPSQAFADSLFLALQRGDTVLALALLDRQPAALPDSVTLMTARLAAQLARARRDTARTREAYRALLARDSTPARQREAAEAAREAGDFATATARMRALLGTNPADTALRAALVETLLSAGDSAGFLAHLDTIARSSANPVRYDRLAVSLEATGRTSEARAAFREAIRLGPTAERWIRLGDRLRWADSLDASLDAYGRALALQPGIGRALEGTAIASRLRREALPTPIFIAPRAADPERGIGLELRASDDNAGWSFRAIGAQAGIPLGGGRTLLAAADARRVGRPARSTLDGARWSAGLAQTVGRARLAIRAGLLSHAGVRDVTTWTVDARAPLGRLEVRGEAARDAAYEVLRAGATLAPGVSDTALTAQALRGTVLGTVRPNLDLWTQVEALRFGDGNRRLGVQAALQRSVAGGVSLVATGGVVGFRRSLPTYWTPSRYALASLGVDLRTGSPERVALYARLLPGVGDVRGLQTGNGVALQLAAGAGASLQRGPWRAEVEAAAGRDREGGYQTWNGALRITRTLP